MSQRFDVLQARERTGRDGEIKTNWTRLGAAFSRDKGGYAIELDALPLPDAQGRVRLLLLEPRERNNARSDRASDCQSQASGAVLTYASARSRGDRNGNPPPQPL